MEVRQYKSNQKHHWDQVLNISKNATFLFRREFMEYHQLMFQDSSLMVFDEEIPVAIFPSNVVQDSIYSHQGLTFGGIIWAGGLSLSIKRMVIESLYSHLSEQGIHSIEIKLVPDFYTNEPNQDLIKILQGKGFFLKEHTTTYVIKNNQDIKERVGRWKLRQKFRQSFIIKEVEDFSGFWNECIYPLYRNQIGVVPTHSCEEIQYLKSKNNEFIKQFLIYQHDSEILGGITVFDFQKVVKFQYIASTPKGKSLRAMDILMEHLLQKVYQDREYIDLGTVHDPITKVPQIGLVLWKESWFAQPEKMFTLNSNKINQQ